MTPDRAREGRLLVIGNDAGEMATIIKAAEPGLDVVARGLADATPQDLTGVAYLLTFRIPDPLGELDGVRFVQSTGAGVDGLVGRIPPGARLARLESGFGELMAEYVVCRCLMIAQRVDAFVRAQRRRRWARELTPRALGSLSITVLGVGAIGGEIARSLSRSGARVTGVSRSGAPVPGVAEVLPATRLDDALDGRDVLVVVVPRTAATERMIGATQISRLAEGAWIVNVARGAVIDEKAMVDAILSGRLGGAALDVFEEEPLAPDHPLWDLDGVWITPHVSGLTTPTQAADAFLANLRRLRAGEPLVGEVDPTRGY